MPERQNQTSHTCAIESKDQGLSVKARYCPSKTAERLRRPDNSSGRLSPYGCPLGCSHALALHWGQGALTESVDCRRLTGCVRAAFWVFDSPRETCQFSLARLLHRGEKCSASGGFTIGQPPSGILLLHCPFFFFCQHVAFFFLSKDRL